MTDIKRADGSLMKPPLEVPAVREVGGRLEAAEELAAIDEG